LVQAAVASLVNQATNWLVAGVLPQKQGSSHPNIAPYGDVFRTADGKDILLAVGSDRQFRDLCTILKIETIADDVRFKTNAARVVHRVELNSILQSQMMLKPADVLMAAIHESKIPAGFIQSMQQVFETPEAKALLLGQSSIAGVRSFVAEGENLKPQQTLASPPHLGEHTHEVSQRLGS
jgi:crotonobetainyl-CoA:carnitine CoA-transferase CaiB-like acyl-CoA transferase